MFCIITNAKKDLFKRFCLLFIIFICLFHTGNHNLCIEAKEAVKYQERGILQNLHKSLINRKNNNKNIKKNNNNIYKKSIYNETLMGRYSDRLLSNIYNINNRELSFIKSVNNNNRKLIINKKSLIDDSLLNNNNNSYLLNNNSYLLKNNLYFLNNNLYLLNNNKFQSRNISSTMTTYTEKVPTVTSLDATYIPLDGCIKAKEICIKEEKWEDKIESISTDTLIFVIPNKGEESAKNDEKSDLQNPIKLPSFISTYDSSTCDGALTEAISREVFEGSSGSSITTRTPSSNKNCRIICILAVDPTPIGSIGTKVGKEILKIAKTNKSISIDLVFPTTNTLTQSQMQNMLETIMVEGSPDNRFKSLKKKKSIKICLEKLNIHTKDKNVYIEESKSLSEGIYFARELCMGPANYVNTISLANAAVEMAKTHGLESKVLNTEEIEALNMGCYLAVGKGSMFPPRFIHLTYKAKTTGPKPLQRIVLIGKGICFDAGGYNIKSAASSIELMKFDMGGAAAVLGTAMAIGKMKPEGVEIHFIVAAAENMVSSKAYRPGDVITASNGKTVEVGNTDAEGRLTLADALVYAQKLKPDAIIDVATLTGAIMIALGYKYAGVFSPHDALAEEVLKSAKKTGENAWRMPIVDEYRELLDSSCADMNNVGGGGKGGAITAAVFLKEFVDNETPWAHIDIAGPVWDMKEMKATGYGVRTLTELVLAKSKSNQ